MTPEKQSKLRNQIADVKAFLDSRSLQSNEVRTVTTMLVRFMETVADGKPSTELPARHHV